MIIFTLDVLAAPGGGIGQRQPSQEGRHLFNIFHVSHSGALIVIADGRDHPDHTTTWLKAEGFKPSIVDFAEDNSPQAKYDRVSALRAVLGHCHWFLDTDPATVNRTLEEGIPSLLVVTPLVARPDWRARTRTSWDSLVERIDTEKLKRAEKTWNELDDDDA